jgi:3-phosphoshikimate 1-carboxyvinyltransferase
VNAIEIVPSGPLRGRVRVPGSKYQANRALVIAALADGESEIAPVPENDDIARVREGIAALGAGVQADGDRVRVSGTGGRLRGASVFVGASGTFARFLAALAGLSAEPVAIDGTRRMRERPMRDLCAALRALGVRVDGEPQNSDSLPLTITGPMRGGACELPGHVSSQFLSALLLAAPYAERDVEIRLTTPLTSRPFVELTAQMMAASGVTVDASGDRFSVRAGQRYRARTHALEADPVSASYFFAAAALTGGDVTVEGFDPASVQGEARFPSLLAQMGCTVERTDGGLRVAGPAKLRAIDADLGEMPDVAQTLAVLAAFADGTTRIRNVAQLAHKESDRLRDTAAELARLGVRAEATADSLAIEGGQAHGALVETHEDHRMAMSFAVAGLAVAGVRIAQPDVVGKSFPQFWDTLRALGVATR